jgi:hypothetical protein
MNFEEFNKRYYLADGRYWPLSKEAWEACKNEVLKIINETPLGYITEEEHIKLEKFADLLEHKVRNL